MAGQDPESVVNPLMASTLRAVIVDDEELARLFLREMLRPHPEVEIAAECANGFDAVKAIGETRPHQVSLRQASLPQAGLRRCHRETFVSQADPALR